MAFLGIAFGYASLGKEGERIVRYVLELSTGFMNPLNMGVFRIHIHCYSIQ